MNILIGADPEIFVKDQNGGLLSAHNMIPGTKKDPYRVDKGAVQVDGMALEFNIDPAMDEHVFAENIAYVMQQMKKMIPHELYISPVAHFGHEYIQQQPPEALELGCDPDYNGWTLMPNPRPDGERPFRTASGHVHIGWDSMRNTEDFATFAESAALAQQLDFYLGLPAMFADPDLIRKELYGKAGAFRNKPYGMEYRVLSNFWLTSPSLMKWVFRAARAATIELFVHDSLLSDVYGDIQEIINTGNKIEAYRIIKDANLEMPYDV